MEAEADKLAERLGERRIQLRRWVFGNEEENLIEDEIDAVSKGEF